MELVHLGVHELFCSHATIRPLATQACSSGLQAAVACSGARLVLCAHSDPWDLERVLQEEKQRCRSTG